MQGRLIQDFKKIVIIEHDVATLEELEDNFGLPANDQREKDTLYVVRLKKATEQDTKLHLATHLPASYQSLVEQDQAKDLVLFKDNKYLLEAKAGSHFPPQDEDSDEEVASSPKIPADTFKGYAKALDQYYQKQILAQRSVRHPSTKLSVVSPTATTFGRSKFSHRDEETHDDFDTLHPVNSIQHAIFSEEEQKPITAFFGSDLIDSLNKIAVAFSKQHEADREAKRSDQEYPGETELDQLITALKEKTPKTPMTKEEAGENFGVLAIATAAQALKEKLGLTLGWWAWKQVLRLIECITQAAPGAWAGAKVGAAAGTAAGAGIGSIPAATVGTVAGGILGGGFTLWVGHKAGAGHWLSHLSTTIAQADHSATADTAITSKITIKKT